MASLYPQMAAMLGKTRLKKLVVGSLAEITADPDAVISEMKAARQTREVAGTTAMSASAQLIHNDGAFEAIRSPIRPRPSPCSSTPAARPACPRARCSPTANLTRRRARSTWNDRRPPPVLVEGEERMLAVLPPFHIYALSVNMLFGIRCAAEIVPHVRFDSEAALEEISSKQISVFPACRRCSRRCSPSRAPASTTSVRSNTADPAARRCRSKSPALHAITGCPLSEGWGMTETSPTGTFTPVQRRMRKPGSCGMPMPGIVIKFLDLEDDPSVRAARRTRRDLHQGPNVMKGYWNKPEATADVTTSDGFLRTGDVGYMDEDGFVFIVDRTKDMILCSGFNVYPRVLEEAIYQHPAVRIGHRDRHPRQISRPVAQGLRQAEARCRGFHPRAIAGVF